MNLFVKYTIVSIVFANLALFMAAPVKGESEKVDLTPAYKLSEKGLSHYKSGRFNESKKYFTESYILWGEILNRAQKPSETIALLRIKPANDLALTHIKLGEYNQAIELLKGLLDQKRKAYRKLGDKERDKFDSDLASAYFNIGLAYEKSLDIQSAFKWYKSSVNYQQNKSRLKKLIEAFNNLPTESPVALVVGSSVNIRYLNHSYELDFKKYSSAVTDYDASVKYLSEDKGYVYLLIEVSGRSKDNKTGRGYCGVGEEVDLLLAKFSTDLILINAKSDQIYSCIKSINYDYKQADKEGRRIYYQIENSHEEISSILLFDKYIPEDGLQLYKKIKR